MCNLYTAIVVEKPKMSLNVMLEMRTMYNERCKSKLLQSLIYTLCNREALQALFSLGCGTMANNLRPLIKKLQTALYIKHQRRININYYQMYSEKAQRTVTKYVLSENTPDDDGNNNYKTLLATWSLPDVVKFLAEQLNGSDS